MRNKKFIITLIITVALAFPAAGAVLGVTRAISQQQSYDEPVEVIVASETIRPYQNLSANMFDTRTMPKAATPENVLTEDNFDDMFNGKNIHASVGLYEGDIIRTQHISEGSGTDNALVSRLSQKQDTNMRAVPVPLPSGLPVEPGDYLDILYTQSGGRDGSPTTTTAFKRVEVLKINESNLFLALSNTEAEQLTNMIAEDRIKFVFSPID